ncbi:Uncharacterised protein [Bordetella pertussis]|nr:Uncharacterised protein [Bordetella pertussis]
MRVQVGHHAGDRVADQRLVVDRLDIVVLDGREHIAELPQFIERQGTAALCDRGHAHAQQDARHRTDGYQTETTKLASAHAHFPIFMPDYWASHWAGSTGAPRWRISKYRPDSTWPPVAPTVAIVSPAATRSPTRLSRLWL